MTSSFRGALGFDDPESPQSETMKDAEITPMMRLNCRKVASFCVAQRLSSGALRGFIAQRPLERWVGPRTGEKRDSATETVTMLGRRTKLPKWQAEAVGQESALAGRRATEGKRLNRPTAPSRPIFAAPTMDATACADTAETEALGGNMGRGKDVRDMTPAAYCKRGTRGQADARTDVTEGTAAGVATRVGAGDTAAVPYAEAGLLTMSPRGPTWR